MPPLSLYIHVPWCIRKCPYCDFNSHQSEGSATEPSIPESDYVDALLRDLDRDIEWAQGRPIETIFIGGGTPSLMSATAYQTLFDGLRQRLVFVNDIEITLEANPGSFEINKFAAYRAVGINRLSIGVQSFHPEHLAALGRIHNRQQAETAITEARKVGFERFNIDLMYGLPGQTVSQALADLEAAIAFQPPHLSWYQLTIEPNTEFYKKPPITPDDDALWDIQEAGLAFLQQQGFEQYEISAHCRQAEGHGPARHNVNYWTFGDYLGIGAGAHGKITTLDTNDPAQPMDVFRSQKSRMPEHYLRHFGPQSLLTGGRKLQSVAADERVFEFLMNALRLHQPVSLEQLRQRTGQDLTAVASTLNQAQHLGLIEQDTQYIRTTARGRSHLNSLLALFLTD